MRLLYYGPSRPIAIAGDRDRSHSHLAKGVDRTGGRPDTLQACETIVSRGALGPETAASANCRGMVPATEQKRGEVIGVTRVWHDDF